MLSRIITYFKSTYEKQFLDKKNEVILYVFKSFAI